MLVNADALIHRFIVLTEGQVPLLPVSITVALVLISEMLLKWPGTLFIISWKHRISVEKTRLLNMRLAGIQVGSPRPSVHCSRRTEGASQHIC